MDYFLEELGKKIKGYRELNGLTQEKLAEKIDVAPNTIYIWEKGKSFIEYPYLNKLAGVLNIDKSLLFDFPPEQNNDNDSDLNKIISIAKQLSPTQQRQILKILETFIN